VEPTATVVTTHGEMRRTGRSYDSASPRGLGVYPQCFCFPTSSRNTHVRGTGCSPVWFGLKTDRFFMDTELSSYSKNGFRSILKTDTIPVF
jgi:hypothetical protein